MSDFEKENKNGASEILVPKRSRISGVRGEVNSDFVLPDYMGDVNRVLKFSADVTPCNKFLSESEASMLFIVKFRVMYLDGDDTLTEACFSADYELCEKLSERFSDASAEVKVQNVSVRLGGPRKISARALLSSDITLIGEGAVCENSDYSGAEKKERLISVYTEEIIKCGEREYAEELVRLPELTKDDVEIIKSDATAVIDGVYKTDGGINVSGFSDAFCLIRANDDIMRFEKRIPIEEHKEAEICESSLFFPSSYVTAVSVNVNNSDSSDGDLSLSVVMNMTVESFVTHRKNSERSVLEDAYYEGCKNECKYSVLDYNRLVSGGRYKLKLLLSAERDERGIHDIIDKEATVKDVRCEISNGELAITLGALVQLIARGTNEKCFALKLEDSFVERIKISGVNEESRIETSVDVCDVSVSFDTEKIYAEVDALVNVTAYEKLSVSMLTSIASERIEDGDRCVFVCYPESGETLWSVSKRYGVSAGKIAAINGFDTNDMGADSDASSLGKIIIVR